MARSSRDGDVLSGFTQGPHLRTGQGWQEAARLSTTANVADVSTPRGATEALGSAALTSSPIRQPPGQRQRLDEAPVQAQDLATGLTQDVAEMDLGDGLVDQQVPPVPQPNSAGSRLNRRRRRDSDESRTVYLCPVVGCPCSDGRIDPGWRTAEARRHHVDLHLIGELSGKPSVQWMEDQCFSVCGVCGFQRVDAYMVGCTRGAGQR